MTDAESLREAIAQYEQQLVQVQATLSTTTQGADRDNLLSLESDIQELINLTKESLQSVNAGNVADESTMESLNDEDEDPLAKEYALFKEQLEKVSDSTENCKEDEEAAGASNNIEVSMQVFCTA